MLGFSYNFGYYPSFLPTSLTHTAESGYINVKVYSLFYKQQVIEWSIPSVWGACTFEIYKSESGYNNWVKITPVPITGNYFKDTTTQNFSKFNQSFYKVEVVMPNLQRVQSKVATWQNQRSNWAEIRANEINRRESLLLTKFTGVKSLVFRRRNFGKRCTVCWDPIMEKVTQDHCTHCLGTSFEGGYFPGYETLIQYLPTPNNPQYGYQGKVEQNTITAWTISYPELNAFDVVLRIPDWKMYRIDALQTTELQTVPVRQMMQLNELDKEMIEFQLALQAIPSGYQV